MNRERFGEYCTAEEVLRYLKIDDYTQDDIDFLNQIIIPNVDWEIDELAGTSWGIVRVKDEWHRMGHPVSYGFWLVARPVYLNYYPISKVEKLEVWQGGNLMQDWTNAEQGRLGRWWISEMEGIVWINWMWWYAGRYDVKVTYWYGYGEYEEIDCSEEVNLPNAKYVDKNGTCWKITPKPLGQVKMLSILMSAYRFLDSERYSNRVADAISDPNTYITQMNRLRKEIEQLREWIKGVSVVVGGQI